MTVKVPRYRQILVGIERGDTIVTAGNRLARELLLHHADAMSVGNLAWQRPAVWSWSAWMRELWNGLAWSGAAKARRRLMSDGRKRALWEVLIRQSGSDGGLVQVHAVARAAAEAWDLARAWGISLADIEKLATEDSARFLEWARAYTALCDQEGLLDEASLPEVLSDLFETESQPGLPKAVMLAGFDEFTPAQDRFLQRLRAAGTAVEEWAPAHAGKTAVIGAADFQAELTAAARWGRKCVAENPDATVGVVVPDLAVTHIQVNRIFADIFAPARMELSDKNQQEVYSISVGLPLLEQPMISAALDLFLLAVGSPPWSEVSRLLRSGFVGESVKEASARASFDVKFRKAGGIRWGLDRLTQALKVESEAGSSSACPALQRRLQDAIRIRAAWPRRQTTRDWVLNLSQWLDAFGWPGERVLDSNEFQAQQRWAELLEEFASYDDILGVVTLSVAIGTLRSLAAQASFKPESSRSPVLVLGALEAAGMEFDHLWVTGLHDGAWPPAPAPTPFLPYSLQRSLLVPRGSSARELQFARVVLGRMVQSATAVRLSWPQTQGDEVLRPSPLIEGFQRGDDVPVTNLVLEGRSGEIFRSRPELANSRDGVAPPCDDEFTASGGSRLLTLQSLCPFRAFAELRLSAEKLEQPSAGLNPRQKGQLAHDSLYFLWRNFSGREALLKTEDGQRQKLIASAINRAAKRIEAQSDAVLTQILAIEKTRLARLMGKVLELESRRPDFSVNEAEQRRELRMGNLRLTVRPDRVDTIGQGGTFVIDYKTGQVNTAKWFGERPRDAQLPLYAVALDIPDVRGIAFLQIKAGATRFAGICDEQSDFPSGMKPPGKAALANQGVSDWRGLMKSWQRILHRLAGEFGDGDARVDPLKSACDFCHLHALCRVEEKKATGEIVVHD